MSLLIQINEKTGEVLHPEVVKLCESFSLLTNEEMLYVVLFADYNSIYKQFPEHDRRRKAMWHAFNENATDAIESPRVLVAIKEYQDLQFDPDIELANRLQKRVDYFSDIIDADTNAAAIEKNMKAIRLLRNDITSLRNKVSEKVKAMGVIKGERQLSMLENRLADKKRYKSIIAPK
jgi:hypothetical protein